MIARARAYLADLEARHPVGYAVGLVLACDAALFVSTSVAWGLSCAV